MTTLTTIHPAPMAFPRGSVWAAQAALGLRDVWKHLFTRGPLAERTRAEEAESLRAYALSLRQSDPGLSADLYAAADRHDLQA
jgi:hypothetical protein